MLTEGDILPDFTLTTAEGGTLQLGQLGRPLVLYFYPKADTPGCTTEAIDFSERKAAFDMAGASIVGVSRDEPKAIGKFVAKHALKIVLASDTDGALSDAFGTWGEKSMYGKTYMGMERATVLIGTDGRIARIWRKVKVPGHAEAVLEATRALAAE